MDTSWDKIQEALTAAIRGDEMPPVVSQRTLFGIPSTVEVQMAKFAAELAHERAVSQGGGASTDARAQSEAGSSGDDAVEATLRKRVKAAAREMGADALIGRGMRYFIFAGREAGFDIPAYPFDPKGELKDFLAERGVRNLPGYYAGLGIPQDRYEDVQTHALLVLRRPDASERGVLLRGAEYCDATRFVPLCESRFLDLCDAGALRAIARELHVDLPSSASR
ncbi:MAG: hypothetical protein MSA55_02640 [Coriobacteriaceae bacterium]|nr:hypothetical protein [Coriobacteriaceae bacterium]